MQTLTAPIRKLGMTLTDGNQALWSEVDVTSLNAEAIQDACDQIVDAMLIEAGILEVARSEA